MLYRFNIKQMEICSFFRHPVYSDAFKTSLHIKIKAGCIQASVDWQMQISDRKFKTVNLEKQSLTGLASLEQIRRQHL